MLPADLTGILLALSSAFVWGSGDFSGGVASRRANSFQVLALSALSGIGVLAIAIVIWRESFPSPSGMMISMLAGIAEAVGITALYRALSQGNSASVAPTSAIIGAAIPVSFTMLTEGMPPITRLVGFFLAFAGIWLVFGALGAKSIVSKSTFLLACLAGLGFGIFFTLIAQAGSGKVFTPLILARSVMFLTGLGLLRKNRLGFPPIKANLIAVLAGTLDAGGNILFMLAREFTRLDSAVVLSSLYPASTVFLAAILLKERITRWQGLGVALCLGAIALITM